MGARASAALACARARERVGPSRFRARRVRASVQVRGCERVREHVRMCVHMCVRDMCMRVCAICACVCAICAACVRDMYACVRARKQAEDAGPAGQ